MNRAMSKLAGQAIQKPVFKTVVKGEGFEKRIFLQNQNGEFQSFWNDIPLKSKDHHDMLNICIEIPRYSLSKLEVSKTEKHHPIMQDTRKNKFSGIKELRSYAQFPLFNYGFLPQTWENSFCDTPEGFKGDDDPLDVCDLSSKLVKTGDIIESKILGAFCLIDQGEVDWKILSINDKEAKQNNINSLDDFEKYQPGRLKAVKNWFEYIKVFDGKKPNYVHYDGKIFDSEKAYEIIEDMNQEWFRLRSLDLQLSKSNHQVSDSDVQQYKDKSQEYLMTQ